MITSLSYKTYIFKYTNFNVNSQLKDLHKAANVTKQKQTKKVEQISLFYCLFVQLVAYVIYRLVVKKYRHDQW